MKVKIILAIISLVCGIGLYAASDYITEQVAIGRGQIYKGQKTVDTINQVIDQGTRSPGLGGLVTGGAQDKIDSGRKKANYYDRLASNLRLGGLGLVILSAFLFLWAFLNKKKK